MHVTPSFPHMHDYPPAGGQQIKYTKDQIPKESPNRTNGVYYIATLSPVKKKNPVLQYITNKIPGFKVNIRA